MANTSPNSPWNVQSCTRRIDQHRRRLGRGEAGNAAHLLHVEALAGDLLVLELDVELRLAVELAKGVADLDEQSW